MNTTDANLCLDQVLSSRLVLIIVTPESEIASLLADWQRQNSIRVFRLVLDNAHNSPERFLYDLQSTFGMNTSHAGDQASAPAVNSIEDSLIVLLNSTLDCAEHMILVLENYHVIRDARIHSAVTLLLDYLPPCIHLVISTLKEPPFLPIPRLRARRQLVELRI